MRVLCVDSSCLSLSRLKRSVRRIVPGADVRCCRDPGDALTSAGWDGCDVLLSEIDIGRNKWEGLKLAERIKESNPQVNIVFITALSERECAEDVLRLRVSGFLTKPWREEALAEEFRNLRYPVAGYAADAAAAQELPPACLRAVGGGTAALGVYQPGFRYREAALAFFRQRVGEETYAHAMSSEAGRHHYVAARIYLDQADWEKFVWIEQYGSLDGFPG